MAWLAMFGIVLAMIVAAAFIVWRSFSDTSTMSILVRSLALAACVILVSCSYSSMSVYVDGHTFECDLRASHAMQCPNIMIVSDLRSFEQALPEAAASNSLNVQPMLYSKQFTQ